MIFAAALAFLFLRTGGALAASNATPAPVPAPPAATPRPVRIPPQQLLEKLRALGAEVWVKNPLGNVVQVKSAAEMAGTKFTFSRVDFPAQTPAPDEKPLTVSDYDLLDHLADLPELGLNGETVNDAVIAKLRPFKLLHSLYLGDVKLTAPSFTLIAGLPELRDLQLRGTGLSDVTLKMLSPLHKLRSLHLAGDALSDDGLAVLGQFPALEELELSELEKITPIAFAHVAECRALKSFYSSGITLYPRMLEYLGQCRKLESVALSDAVLKDADIQPLASLSKLRALDLSESSVTGGAFASWPARVDLTSLNLHGAGGVDDAGFKNIGRAFPKISEMTVKLAPGGMSAAAFVSFRHLANLHSFSMDGPGVSDQVAAELAHCETLTALAIPGAQLTEKGVAALSHLTHLTDLSIDAPPISDPALKVFGRWKTLKSMHIGKDAVPETEFKLRGALPNLEIQRAE